jgi:hypothetical protein
MFKNKNTFIITYEKEFKELITIWIKIADAALTSSMRSWALAMATGILKPYLLIPTHQPLPINPYPLTPTH